MRTTVLLICRHQQGDQEAFTELCRRHEDVVRKSIARRLGRELHDLLDVDDILQETLIASWQCLEEGRFEDLETVGGFRNLLVKIALRKLKDASRKLRTGKRDQARKVGLEELKGEATAPGASPARSRAPGSWRRSPKGPCCCFRRSTAR